MYDGFRSLAERLLRVPPAPEPPPGDEASARVFLAAPQYLKYLQILWLLRTGFALLFTVVPLAIVDVALLYARSHGRRPDAIVIALVISLSVLVFLAVMLHAVFDLAVMKLDFDKRWYVVTDRSLRIREGVVKVREITFTFANIQNLSITQGPIQRAFGIANLKVETAGGGSAEAVPGRGTGLNLHTAYFRGIANAAEVKELIQQRLRGLKDSGLGDHEELVPASAGATTPALLEALRAVHAEARALRLTAE
jgi:membrane protein YdbS with pleckstrin-like domain